MGPAQDLGSEAIFNVRLFNQMTDGKHSFDYQSWASAAGVRGAVAPLDFQTWYKYSR